MYLRRSTRTKSRWTFNKTRKFLVAGIFIAAGLYGQAPDTLWTRLYGTPGYDYFLSAAETPDSAYIVSGMRYTSFSYKTWLLKVDLNGDTLWTRTYGLNNTVNVGYDVKPITNGGYIITGYTVPYNSNNYDVLLIKTDGQGDTAWIRRFGGDTTDLCVSVDETPDRGFITTGYTESFGNGSTDLWLIKVDTLGDWQFAKTLGGSYEESGNSVQTTRDSCFIVAGYNCSSSLHGMDGWLLKFNALGDTIWTKLISNGFYDNFFAARELTDGGYIITGWTLLAETLSIDLSLIRTDSLGNVMWTKAYGGFDIDAGFSVEPTPDHGFIVGGITYSFGNGGEDFWVLKTDSLGDTLWTKTLGSSADDESQSLITTSDNGYLVTGSTMSFGAGYSDGWLVKLGYLGGSVERKSIPTANWCQIMNNPVRGRVEFSIALNTAANVSLKIYDATGRLYVRLFDGQMHAGEHRIKGPEYLNAGVYFFCLETPIQRTTGKFVMVR